MLFGRELSSATGVTPILGDTCGSGTGGHSHRPCLRAAEHPPAHSRLPASMWVTDFVFSVGNEIQSHKNNCVCFPYRFQSCIASHWKIQILIKFASPLIFNAIGCKFLSWMAGASLNTWASAVSQFFLNRLKAGGEQTCLYMWTVIFKWCFYYSERRGKTWAAVKPSLQYELSLLPYPPASFQLFSGLVVV